MTSSSKVNVQVENIKIAAPAGDKILSADDVKKQLVSAINSIPADRLKGFRGGQITIVS